MTVDEIIERLSHVRNLYGGQTHIVVNTELYDGTADFVELDYQFAKEE